MSYIRNMDLMRQPVDLGTDLVFRNGKRPTDIDACMEADNKVFIFQELKYNDNELSWGQSTALRRLVEAISLPAFCLIATHDVSIFPPHKYIFPS